MLCARLSTHCLLTLCLLNDPGSGKPCIRAFCQLPCHREARLHEEPGLFSRLNGIVFSFSLFSFVFFLSAALVSTPDTQLDAVQICRSFAQTGECRYGRRCRFIHPEGLTGSAAEYATLGTPNSLMTHGSGSLSASSDPFPRSVQSSVHLGQNPSLLSYSDPAPHAMHSASSCSGSLPVDSVQQLHQKLSAYLPLSTPSAADSLGAQYQLLPPQDPSGSLIGAASHQEHHAAGVTMQGGHALDLFNHTFSPSLNMYTAGPGMTHAYTHMLPPLADSSAFSLPGSSLDAPLAQLSPDTLQLSPEMSQLSPELLHLLLASSTGLPGSPAYSTVPQFVEQSSQWLNHLDQVGLSQQLQGLGSNPHAVMDQLAAPGCGPSLISHQARHFFLALLALCVISL